MTITIKAKLIANVLVTAAIIAALSAASFFSMRFLQGKLSYLTEQSTPFQIRTIELQRELQGAVSALLELNGAGTMAELKRSKAAAEKKLASVVAAQQLLEQQHNAVPGLAEELGQTAQQLFAATEARITSGDAARTANERAGELTERAATRLKELDSSLRSLQTVHSAAFNRALETTDRAADEVNAIEFIRGQLKELQLLTKTLQMPQTAAGLLVARGRFNTVAGRINRHHYTASNQAFSASYQQFETLLVEQLRLLVAAQARKDEQARLAVATTLREQANSHITQLLLMLDQERDEARSRLATETGAQKTLHDQSNKANTILVASSELVTTGLRLNSEINRLFTLEEIAGFEQADQTLRALFSQIQERSQNIARDLRSLQADKELQLLRAATDALAATRQEVTSGSGILNTLKTRLKAVEQADLAARTLHDLAARQTFSGNKIIATAKGEQEQAMLSVNRVLDRNLLQITAIGVTTVLVAILFGFWIYRSVLLPLRLVLHAVRSQQAQGQEKAQLAKAVAGGDLNREVRISEVISIGGREQHKDEMGMMLKAVAEMSEAQATLDRALADMTSSLRAGRDEDQRRDHLKNGLFELNRILREEHSTDELLEYSLAFICAFLDAGVGIFYLYDEEKRLLLPKGTYAVSLANRPDHGQLAADEGLVGQVATSCRPIHLTTVPPGYLTVCSALGEADPLQIAILPVMHNGQLAGVLELGSFKPFDEYSFSFLEQALEGIAVAINSNRSHQLISELLEQTQVQAEELRVREEELQQTNQELQERARILEERAS